MIDVTERPLSTGDAFDEVTGELRHETLKARAGTSHAS